MALLPIIERELRVALRKRRPVRRRLQVAALASAGTLLFLLFARSGGPGARHAGHTLHQLLCLAAGYLVLQTPQLTAGGRAPGPTPKNPWRFLSGGAVRQEVFLVKSFSGGGGGP